MTSKRKKPTPQQSLQTLCQKANDTITRWKSHKENGCNDPTWPDGVNMNLLRNHLFSYKGQIRELCAENNFPLPLEAFLPNLPYTDENYFAKPYSERAQRIMSRPGWQCHNKETPKEEYDETVLTLF
jgi:hypothetical protein